MKTKILHLSLSIACLLIISLQHLHSQVKIPPEKPELVITLIVEQMRNDYLQRYWSKMGTKGFKRIINEGTYFRNASYGHLLNHSGSGIASVITGSHPSEHGIVADEWYDHLRDRNIESTLDESARGVGGSSILGNRSPVNLITSTYTDALRLSNNMRSRVYSVSANQIAAVLGGGHLANSSWWFNPESGGMMTSSHYTGSLPEWVRNFNSKKFADIYLERNWELMLPEEYYSESLPQKNPYRTPFDSRNDDFPYDLKKIREKSTRYDLLQLTPFGNTFIKDFALSLIAEEQLGKKGHTDALFISFSANSSIGYRFGILSRELQDAYLQLDRDLGHFLDFIDENYGKENVLIVLTSDRGANHHPAYLREAGMPTGEFNQMQAIALLKSYLNVSLGQGDWVKAYHSRQVYMNQQLIEDSKLDLFDIQNKVSRFLLQFSGVAAAIPAHNLQQSYYGGGIQHKVQNGYMQKRSGDVILVLQQGWNERINNINSSNSLPVTENHVPLVFYGWKMNRNSVNKPVPMTAVAPTLINLLGISPSSSSGTDILQEVIR